MQKLFHKRKKINWLLLVASFISLSTPLFADNWPDTVHIKEVVISSNNISSFQTGAKIEKIDPIQVELLKDGNLEQLLSRTTPIAFKAMSGSLSTVRVRGTSPDHTSFNFGGININSLTLGHSNVSNIPMFLFDEIGIQYGGSSAVNGSGSIGGAVHLGINNRWTNDFSGEGRVAVGSFGEQLYGTKIFIGNGSFESVTRAYYYYKKNNFPFFNFSMDVEKRRMVGDDVQRFSSIENKGIIQEFNYRFDNQSTLVTRIWFEDDWHQIQPNMSSNAKPNTQAETYEDNHVRIWTAYNTSIKKVSLNVGAGYVYDIGIHNKTDQKISTQRIVTDVNGQYQLFKNTRIKTGLKYSYIKPEVYAYPDTINFEQHCDIYLSAYQKLFNKLELTANLRKGFITDFTVPYTPAFGASVIGYRGEYSIIKFKGNIAFSYRVPTLNDRFWPVQGKDELVPENGINYETGFTYSYQQDDFSGSIKANLFYMNVSNWLLWVNDGGWVPKNIQKVKSKGVEIQGNLKVPIAVFSINPGFNILYNPVIREKADSASQAAVGRQLEYVPLFSGNTFLTITYGDISLGADFSYRSEQYTDQNITNILEAYDLLNFSGSYKFKIGSKNTLRIQFLANNILGRRYQSTWGYPMPGRNYRLSINYNFN